MKTKLYMTAIMSLMTITLSTKAVEYTNNESVSITSCGAANPYPSTIEVTGLNNPVDSLTISLDNFTHTYPTDVVAILESPNGTSVVLMATIGGAFAVYQVDITIQDGALSFDEFNLSSGIYSPTNNGTTGQATCMPDVLPEEPFGSSLSEFSGIDGNGTWSLYVYDRYSGDGGSIAGWSMDIVEDDDNDDDGILNVDDLCPESPNVYNQTQDLYFPSIQNAFDNAVDNDVIILGECTFFEDNLHLPVNVDITLRGSGRDKTFLDGSQGSDLYGVFEMINTGQTTDTVVENLTIQNDSRGLNQAARGGAVFLFGVGMTLNKVDITGNTCPVASGARAIQAREGSTLIVNQCRIYDNQNDGSAAVLVLNSDAEFNNTFIRMIGLTLSAFSDTTVTNCTFDGIVRSRDEGHTTIRNSVIDGSLQTFNDGTIDVQYSMFEGGTGTNIDAIPQFIDPGSLNYNLPYDSPGIDAADPNAYFNITDSQFDIEGKERMQDDPYTGEHGDSMLDIGAFEFAVENDNYGACCSINGCVETYQIFCEASPYVCDHYALAADLGQDNYNGCLGDLDFDGFTTPADRGQISANLNTTLHEAICRYDMDGDGFVTAADRGIISANLDPLCTDLPDYMNGSGLNGGEIEDRFGPPGNFISTELTCDTVLCAAPN